MTATQPRHLSEAEIVQAKQIWADYQVAHDLSAQDGQVAGIDPRSGRVWLGQSGVEIAKQMQAESVYSPLYIVRIGADYYVRKGGRG